MTRSSSSRAKVTTSQIAQLAGVSPSTVSLVLNRRGDDLRINRDTQQRVMDAAKQLNYVPNYLARGLSGGSTKSIGMLWPLGGSPSNAAIAYQLLRRLARRGYVAHMTDHLRDRDFSHRALLDLLQRKVDGLIFYTGGNVLDDPRVVEVLGEFSAAVLVSPRREKVRFDLIHHDRQQAMREIADHLVGTGRRHVGILTVGNANELKINALRQRLHEHGLTNPGPLVLEPFDFDDTTYVDQVADELARQHGKGKDFPFDAVVCTDDDQAAALLHWLRKVKLSVPQRVAVVGFNDVPVAAHLDPPLASVARYDEQVSNLAEQWLFERLRKRDLPPRHETVAMSFTWRPSAGGDGRVM